MEVIRKEALMIGQTIYIWKINKKLQKMDLKL